MKNKRILTLCIVLLLTLMSATTVIAENSAPIAENMEITTYYSTSIGGTLSALDPEGEVLTFEISTDPIKGTLELSEDGVYLYTPADGKKGKDYFGYRAIDSEGNKSYEATVIIKIEKPKGEISYADMAGNPSEYAAVRLAEEGILIGECLGGEYVFGPDEAVTRGEFLAMCMKLADVELLSGVTRTGFSDDGDIPQWLRTYVSTALMCGTISGQPSETGAQFRPDDAITSAEGMLMLNNVLSLSDVSYGDCAEDVPTWASQAVMNLSANRIVDAQNMSEPIITRAECANILARSMEII